MILYVAYIYLKYIVQTRGRKIYEKNKALKV